MTKLVSIIVPIYNVENYLKRCIDSILNQSYKNIEVILVNDGSLDGCREICEEYLKKDNRIKLINKENGGLSSARNAGIDIAVGEYISFIDSDDEIELDMIETLVRNLQKYDSCISVGGVIEVYPTHANICQTNIKNEIEVIDKESSMKKHLLGSWAVWDKIYKSELFNQIRFPEGKINEDEAIMIKLLDKAEKIVYTNKIVYKYYKREKSITSSGFSKKQFDWLTNCKNNMDFIEQKYPSLKNYAHKRYNNCIIWLLENIILCENIQFNTEKDMLINIVKKDIKNIINNKSITQSNKIKSCIIILNYNLYSKLYKLKQLNYANSIVVRTINKMIWIKSDIIDYVYKMFLKKPNIKSIEETIENIINNRCSVSRYGDGEFLLINGENLGFQKSTTQLALRLEEILKNNETKHMVCLPDIFDDLSQYTPGVELYWKSILFKTRLDIYKKIDKEKIYYNAFISRPYHMYKDKLKSKYKFELVSKIWDDRNVIIVEGEKTRLGIGNDILDNSKTIKRIICPSEDAFEKYDKIINSIKKVNKEDLILIALGPTATVLAYDLCKLGYQAIDIGHIDIEYEWFLRKSEEKIPIINKYVNEVKNGSQVAPINDSDYKSQILYSV